MGSRRNMTAGKPSLLETDCAPRRTTPYNCSTAAIETEQLHRGMFKRLLSPPEQSRAAKTVEIYGWIIFAEGGLLLLFPDFMARLMHFGPLTLQASGIPQAGSGLLTWRAERR